MIGRVPIPEKSFQNFLSDWFMPGFAPLTQDQTLLKSLGLISMVAE